ncbi:hypothetical protein BMIN10S_01912 [Bosea minatitlanensis]
MAIRKRGSSWQWDRKLNGIRYRETFKTEREAKDWDDIVLQSLAKGDAYPCRKGPTTETEDPKPAKKDIGNTTSSLVCCVSTGATCGTLGTQLM